MFLNLLVGQCGCMNKKRSSDKHVISSRLGKRIAILILLFSSCFTLISTSLQLALDYRADINRIEQQFNIIQASYLNAITLSVWSYDDSQLKTQLLGLSQLPDIEYVAIKVEDKTSWEAGAAKSSASRIVEFPLIYNASKLPDRQIGTLLVTASIDNVYKRLINKAGVILVSNGIKTFLVSGFILLLIWFLIAKHLKKISEYIASLNFNKLSEPLQLDKKEIVDKPDEIDTVSHTINYMRKSLHDSYQRQQKLLEERNALLDNEIKHKLQLEDKVAERTKLLEESMDDLRSTQNRLIETEKMAALGNLVAGVAHEINTPIGICLTAIGVQEDHCRAIRNSIAKQALTQKELDDFLHDIEESNKLFSSSIIKSSELISNFKLIATDQRQEEKYEFNLNEYLTNSLQTMQFQLKEKKITCTLNIPEDIYSNSYPGAYHHILSNLINNSIIHGFANGEGNITIDARKEDDFIVLTYHDNGRGLSQYEAKNLFEPFFTTKRGKGGIGLGMTIVYNAVSQLLQGEIKIINKSKPGFHIEIKAPVNVSESAEEDGSLTKT